MKYKYVISLIFCFLMCSCASQNKKLIIPVYSECYKSKIPIQPNWPIDNLKPGDNASIVIKSYVITVHSMKSYITQLQDLLKGHKNEN